MKTYFTKLVLLCLTLVALGFGLPANATLERVNDPDDGSVSITTDVIDVEAKVQVVGICVLLPQKGSKPIAPVASLIFVSETPRPDWSGAPTEIVISTPTQTFSSQLSYSKEEDNMASLQIIMDTPQFIHLTHWSK